MKIRILAVCTHIACGLFLGVFLLSATPAFAAGATDQALNRLSSLESRWGHLHLGGRITFSADYFTTTGSSASEDFDGDEYPSLKGSSALWQELELFLNARLDRHFDLSLAFSRGRISSGTQQLSGFSLFLNEALLRYRSSTSWPIWAGSISPSTP